MGEQPTHQGSRAEHQGGALPPDKDAMGLVEAIIAEATHKPGVGMARRELSLARIFDNATRLKVLLADRDEEREALVAAATALVADRTSPGEEPVPDWCHHCDFWRDHQDEAQACKCLVGQLAAALARVKGDS